MKPRIYKRYGAWVLNYAGSLYRFRIDGWFVAMLACEHDFVREQFGSLVPNDAYYHWF